MTHSRLSSILLAAGIRPPQPAPAGERLRVALRRALAGAWLCALLGGATAGRAETFQDAQGLVYTYDAASPATCYVSGHTDALASAVAIPTAVGGRTVIRVGDGALFGCTALTSVTLGDSIRSVGYAAFYGCTALRAIELPPATARVEAFAFAGCSALEYLDLGEGLSTVCEDAFAGCTALTALTLPPQVDSLCFRAFADCTALADVSLGAGLTHLDPFAFAACPALGDLTVSAGNSVYHTRLTTRVPSSAEAAEPGVVPLLLHSDSGTLLRVPDGAAQLLLPYGVRRIRSGLCYGSANLRQLSLPGSIEDIDLFAFADCPHLDSVYTFCFEPYAIDGSVFQTYDAALAPTDSVYHRATLFVPVGTRSAYLATPGWNRFVHIEEFDALTDIDVVPADAPRSGGTPVRAFSPDGSRRPLPGAASGGEIHIIRFDDGTSAKVLRAE